MVYICIYELCFLYCYCICIINVCSSLVEEIKNIIVSLMNVKMTSPCCTYSFPTKSTHLYTRHTLLLMSLALFHIRLFEYDVDSAISKLTVSKSKDFISTFSLFFLYPPYWNYGNVRTSPDFLFFKFNLQF